MNKLIKSWAAVDGMLCRMVRVRDSLEDVGAEREEGRRHHLHFQKWCRLGDRTPKFCPFPSSVY